MKKKKVAIQKIGLTLLLVIIGLAASGIAVVNYWKRTPYGTLHTNAALLLKVIDVRGIDLFRGNPTPAEIRAASATGRALLQNKPTPIAQIRDTTLPGPAGPIPIRIYISRQRYSLPVIIYYHGGGWTMGDLNSHDNICRSLCEKIRGIVVSVDYRLAPEHPFPAAVDDAYAALRWVSLNAAAFHGDKARIAIAGDSAGGNLAAAIALISRDQNGPQISAQILIYPVINLADMRTDSYRQFAEGFYLTKRYMENFRAMYLPHPEDWQNVYASPLLSATLKNLPPALVLTAEFDPLRDECEAYAERLKKAGVTVDHICYKGMIHGFVGMDRLFGQSQQAIGDISYHLLKYLQ